MSPHDVDDFTQTVHLRMAERQYDALRRFEGRASFRTYLTVVVVRMLKDWQNREYGKWRPCAAASRLGKEAERLDRLINRDGYSLDEAVRTVNALTGTPEEDVRRLADRLPRRMRKQLVPIAAADSCGVPFLDPLAERQRRRQMDAAMLAVRQAFARLPREEARLMFRRFLDQQSVRSLAHQTSVDAKALYRRFERVRKTLRAQLQARGVNGSLPADSCDGSAVG